MNSRYEGRKPNGQHLEMTLPPFNAPPPTNDLLCHDLSVLFGQFYVFLKTNGMPISEKEISTNTSGSVGINIYSWALKPT